ncbi:M48 family metallopeptidase [Parathalassolituus penaei]|uniref:SprT family zinc-dependent metalloprotease n=1 Tax=Parathalassolituus penaei TaxID=2997323 RepID=A0A9X3E9X0_9GAMM|nr:SprT family zinc-dependent metalloprotease [Parathalassolituus penaei]MCY0963588.1 SprT family zinc-dependent metalloprotease [Parathalassolituus penaei]
MQRKSIRLIVTESGEIDLRIPFNSPKDTVDRFLRQHEAWILQRRQAFAERARQQQENNSVHYLGKPLSLGQWSRKTVGLEGQQLMIPATVAEHERQLWLDDWFTRMARQCFEDQIARWWPAFSHTGKPPVLRVKKMRTRWGSLSKLGYINLNRLLVHMDPQLIELVVVHELCHLEHFDHGPGFQRLMSKHLPDWRSRDRQLRNIRINGFSLGC